MYKTPEEFMEYVKSRNPNQPEFHQAVHEVVTSVWSVIESSPKYQDASILERMIEPERVLMFRVTWTNDTGGIEVNKGYRIQMNSAIGPYKGGIRFHPSVNLSILKFLAFEQVFKNSLTTLPMGGGKGGADFDPKGKSDVEIMRFCHNFILELARHIGPNTDVPAGDIGVGTREVGFMFGMYKKLRNEFTGVFTGKGLNWGGSLIRPEATGYGVTYFAQEMLKTRNKDLNGKTVAISGSGNVAQYAVQKVTELGGKVVTLSDSDGTIYDREGINGSKLAYIMDLKNSRRGRIKEYANEYKNAEYFEGARPWSVECEVALPCATQNEISEDDAKSLIKNGCYCISEGANMPTVPEGVKVFLKNEVLYGPGKAANAGGVATSGLEMTQNSMRLSWSREEVDTRLKAIMKSIHQTCVKHGKEGDFTNYVKGANIGGFIKVADTMIDQGTI
ncbi:MAG: NADP-specific glutamate dehydrogenase [Nitrososphaerota archaeon]|jgi:glutamate dehydrogenase (NADP+)|uniref:NADP-specific glutamate dehydrogenase n=1 Tax=Candidatus Bathycorpusculum sp. TaxID=2994959 RepID=UPI00282EF477|nr:NADP-specific glutamate dehydrogenase [Candidatus Termiticorpusculum sp.]MCL2257478.1 NADP-specific glutamate dehydrogenase [Candidatus Termiticorpusculum sp.]MCL2292391.1 NADP-specific glutamate dehydrogenase [Candidatus Termiticorpusculum sp.]MDR0460610.1 NADP-specific glutamate dehydrogenase [Nitrososphaerota archaeon]